MTKDKMVEIFKTIGLTKEQMTDFHKAFESRHPAEHQSFLEWLNIPANEIAAIRKQSK